MVKKIENRNIDVTKARGELEEDLLEYVYRTWRQGRQITSKEYAREVNITGYEAAGLVRSLVKKGFLCEPENGHLELSDQAVSDAKNNYAEANYTKDSYENLKSAIKEAEEVLAKSDATADEMKEQVDKLDKAVKALVRLDDAVDKLELNGYIENALTKKNDGTYTDNSWNSFQAAIKSAQKVSADVNATKAEVEKQTKLLTSSYEALVVKNKQSDLFKDYPQIFEGTYSVPIKMLNATSDEDSMGNASMVQTGIVRVTGKGEVTLEMNFQSMQFAGMTGYLYKLKKVDMDTVEYNKYNYPVKYEASDATVLEEYTDVYDSFNQKIITERQQKRYKPRKCLCFLGFSYVQRFKGHHKKVQISDGN